MTKTEPTARQATLTLLAREPLSSERKPKVTRRELEVLQLISEGLNTRDISRRLWVSDETVKTHVRRLLNKLEARTRAHAVANAFRRGLLRP
jgi:DNA-binding NarL/FixJ family response regulator